MFPLVISFAGYANSGKDTSGTAVERAIHRYGLRSHRVAFADAVRMECWLNNGQILIVAVPGGPASHETFRNILVHAANIGGAYGSVDAANPNWTPACAVAYDIAKRAWPQVRAHLVEYGQLRRNQDPLYWIKRVLPETREGLRAAYPKCEVLIITDVRQHEEGLAVLRLDGTVVHVTRDGVTPADATEASTIAQLAEALKHRPGYVRLRNIEGNQVHLQKELGSILAVVLLQHTENMQKIVSELAAVGAH
jgi:hypothetical protein